MNAMQLKNPQAIEHKPLIAVDIPVPSPRADQVLIRVSACGICHTDLHIIEGELPAVRLPVVPGHQVVGVVEKVGRLVSSCVPGERVGVAWLNRVDGTCEFCRSGNENLCDSAFFTGYHFDGGYAEYMVSDAAFIYKLPPNQTDFSVAPMLCAGIIGFRALNLSGVGAGERLGIFGFGAAAHIVLQLAKGRGCEVYVFSRNEDHHKLAKGLGADWIGTASEPPPHLLHGAINFAPAGSLVLSALAKLRKGGTLTLAGIYMTPIPQMEYNLLYQEKSIRSVTNNTYRDGVDFLREAEKISLKTETEIYPLYEANEALIRLKSGKIRGAGVLAIQ